MKYFIIEAVQTQPVLSNDYKTIVAVRGHDDMGKPNSYFLAGIIQIIEAGIPVFVIHGGYQVRVEVVFDAGIKYIRTQGDSIPSNNLLRLPRF